MSSDDGATSAARPAAGRSGAVGRSEQPASTTTAEAVATVRQVFGSISDRAWLWQGALYTGRPAPALALHLLHTKSA